MTSTQGLHHITAICSTPHENVEFYTKVLGLDLVKQTVNQDDTSTYHLYYADSQAQPGALMTFFTWTQLPPAQAGVSESRMTGFSIPKSALTFWMQRLREHGVSSREIIRFGQKRIEFTDPHGLPLALVEQEDSRPPATSKLPAEYAIRGFCGITLCLHQTLPTAQVIKLLGYAQQEQEGTFTRFVNDSTDYPNYIDLDEQPSLPLARQGVGSTHHIAFRTQNTDTQKRLVDKLAQAGLRPTQNIDRFYFRSVYFREPGGILFEIATDGPGFAVDEPANKLGKKLVLPPWLKEQREQIVQRLPPLQ